MLPQQMAAIGSTSRVLSSQDATMRLLLSVAMVACTLFLARRHTSTISKRDLVGRRHAARSQSVSHSHDPLIVMRGDGAYLIDEQGRRYLDSRNNVASIGHQHPLWVNAVCTQVALTNTNARYLHPLRVELVETLLQTLPSNLEICFFVNSGSEANELALRLAKAYTKRRTILAMEMGYHGFTNTTLEASPYKWQKKYGLAQPENLRVVQLGEDATPSVKDKAVGCFIMESALSVAGVQFPPPGWVKETFQKVRANGGVCISDEVQVGLGRTGRFWAFEHDDCTPDIVTIGKGLGNGFPIGVVVCTKAIADALDAEGREVFSTFGGNPVACAAALSVLKTVKDESLIQNCADVGKYLCERLKTLNSPLIVDIRGRGLFVGIEFTSGEVASSIGRVMYDSHHVLTSFDGYDDCVMVIKPPMCWGHREADLFVDALSNTLAVVS